MDVAVSARGQVQLFYITDLGASQAPVVMRAKHLHLLLSYSSSFSGSECGRPGAPGGMVTLAEIP